MTSLGSDDSDRSQEAVFRFVADPKTHGLSEPVKRVDTANAVVFLAGADVYKLKRAVKFPFMDLSTVDKRRDACVGGNCSEPAPGACHLPSGAADRPPRRDFCDWR